MTAQILNGKALAKKIRDEILEAKNSLKAENDRMEKMRAEEMLAGTAGGQQPKKELSDKDYAQRALGGSL